MPRVGRPPHSIYMGKSVPYKKACRMGIALLEGPGFNTRGLTSGLSSSSEAGAPCFNVDAGICAGDQAQACSQPRCYPIGSGEAEAANKMLVTHRLERSGQSWGRDGGQGVLSFRAPLKSDRFDRAWSMVVPRMARKKGTQSKLQQRLWQIRDAA